MHSYPPTVHRGGHQRVAREISAAYDAGEVGPSLRDAVRAASTWLQRVLELAADGRVEGGELEALLELLPALDRGHAAAVALTDTALAGSLPERKAGLNYDTLLAMRTKATYTERGRLQRLAQLLRKLPNLRAAYHRGLIGTGQLTAIATEATVLTGEGLAALDACFADTDRLSRLEPDQLVDLARVEIDRLRPDLAERRETRTVERSFLHLQPCLDGSGEGRFGYDSDAFASIVAAIDHAAGPPSTDTDDANSTDADGSTDGDGSGEPAWFDPIAERPRARQRADGLLALCEAYLAGEPTTDAQLAGEHGVAATHRRPPRALRGGRPRPRAVVVLDVAHLAQDTDTGRVARLLWGLHGTPPALTHAAARRLASDAQLQLLLTDGHTVLGITAPTASIPTRLREAVAARDQGCRFGGCRAPIAWCDLHHVTGREDGGPTVLANLVALCRRHHTSITSGRWNLSMTDDGTVTVRRGRVVHTTDPPLHATLAPD